MSRLKQVSSLVKELKNISETVTREPTCDTGSQYSLFGQSVAAQLMTLRPVLAIKAQEQIQTILTQYKLLSL